MKYFFYEKEIKSLLTSSVDKRIRYFIHKVADWEYLYLPYDKQRGLDTVYDDAGQKGVCVWPFKEFAEVYYKDNLIMKERVKKMSIYKFLKEYVDDLAQLNTNIFVFPVRNKDCACMSAEKFKLYMEEELEKYTP